jgi:peroxin-2
MEMMEPSISRSLSKPVLRVFRVNQMDAHQLDSELVHILSHEALSQVFHHLPQHLVEARKPELEALLNLAIYCFSVCRDVPTPGNKLQNLKYRNERHPDLSSKATAKLALMNSTSPVFKLSIFQKVGYGVCFVGMPWLWARWSNAMTYQGWGGFPEGSRERKIYLFCRYLEIAFRSFSVLNFLVFLVDGKYRSLVERILGMRLVYIRSRMSRQVAFDFMNQQLVWHGFSEFLLFFLPLLNLERVRRFFKRMFRIGTGWANLTVNASGDSSGQVNTSCLICGIDPIPVPCISNCGHRYCDYCLRATLLSEPNYRCIRCEEFIRSTKREQ